MLMNMYSIRDIKAGVFSQPFFAAHDVVAIRMFQGALRSKDTLLSEYPEDYALYRIGVFNERNGKVTQDEGEHVARLGYAYEFMEDKPARLGIEDVVGLPSDREEEDEEEEK